MSTVLAETQCPGLCDDFDWIGQMVTERLYSQKQINRAGKCLASQDASDDERRKAIAVMDHWRSLHTVPLDAARKLLESRAKLINPAYTIGTRLKREESIRAKLAREANMQLSTMQDVGGCRVVLRDMGEVDRLISLYSGDKNVKLTDYVAKPRVSGYRCKHLIWQFKADRPEDICYDNLRIELQIRTELQHSWATAVEVASTFTSQNLKSDHPQFNDDRWVRFFAVAGNLMAVLEGGGLVKDTPTSKPKIVEELKKLVHGLKVNTVMSRWNTATEITGGVANDTKAHNFLIELYTFEHLRCRVTVTAYGKGREREAAAERTRLEMESRAKSGVQIVLVGVHSLSTLRTAYPNYFSDTTRFLRELDKALHGAEEPLLGSFNYS